MEWISVKDRLPEDGVQVLQYNPNGWRTVAGFILQSGAPKGVSIDCLRSNATHWMPLPEPPLDLTAPSDE